MDKIIVISIMCSCTVQLYDFFKYNYPNMSSASVIWFPAGIRGDLTELGLVVVILAGVSKLVY